MKDSKSSEKSGNFIKSKIHNNSQKYSLAIYSAIRKQKFNNYKDVHKDVDELISKNEGFSSDAQRKAAFANGYEEKGKKKNESINEGKKRYYQKDGIGKSKYTISYHDGKKKHKDGSDFFDIQIFRNKKDLAKFVNSLHKGGYVYGFGESVNEASKLAMGIAGLTGTRGSAVQDFINKNRINSKKLFKALKSANLQGRINFASALAGKPNNPNARLTIKLFGESNEDDGVPQGYNPMVEDKKQIKDLVKKVKHEKLFYDVLDTMEKKYGKRQYRIWLEKSLKGFGVNPKHYDYRTNAAAEEKLFQLGK